jgi:hypothetical protein
VGGLEDSMNLPLQILRRNLLALAVLLITVCSAQAEVTGTVLQWSSGSTTSTAVDTGLGVVKISKGLSHSLALKRDGTVVAWGSNSYGESTVPAGLTNVVDVDAGSYESYAVKSDGTVVHWGNDGSGSLGVATGLPSDVLELDLSSTRVGIVVGGATRLIYTWEADRVLVFTDMRNSLAFAVGANHILSFNGKLSGITAVWIKSQSAGNEYGQLSAANTIAYKVDAGPNTTWLMGYDGTLRAFGQHTRIPSAVGSVKSFTVGDRYVFAVRTDNSIVTWDSDDDATTGLTVLSGPTSLSELSCYEDQALAALNETTVTFKMSSPTIIGGSTTTISGKCSLSQALPYDATFTLAGGNTALSLKATTITILTGQLSASVGTVHNVVQTDTAVPFTATLANDGMVLTASSTVQPLKVSKLTFQYNPVEGGRTIPASLTLNAVPRANMSVDLSSPTSELTFPVSVLVRAGASFVPFDVDVAEVAVNTSVALRASCNSQPLFSSTLQILPKPRIASLTFSRDTAYGLQTVIGTVTLRTAARYPNAYVQLAKSNAYVDIPAGITIPEGELVGTFEIKTTDVTLNQQTLITATSGSAAVGRTLNIYRLVPKALTFSPSTIFASLSSTGSVTLNAAPEEDVVVEVSTTVDGVTVPATCTVPAGSATGTFTVQVSGICTAYVVPITVRKNAPRTASLNVYQIASLTIPSMYGTQTVTGTVKLRQAAPASGVVVDLRLISGSGVSFVSSLRVASGATTATFSIKAEDVATTRAVKIRALLGAGAVVDRGFTVTRLEPSSITADPAPGMLEYHVNLMMNATVGEAVTVTLTSSNPTVLSLPATWTFQPGSNFAGLLVHKGSVTTPQTVRLTVTKNGVKKYVDVVVNP